MKRHGGFYGGLSNDLIVEQRSAAFGGAERADSVDVQQRVSRVRRGALSDDGAPRVRLSHPEILGSQYGGVYWTLDRRGCPTNDRKHIYAQAFAIYGLAEFYRATGEPQSLRLAQDLFDLDRAPFVSIPSTAATSNAARASGERWTTCA